MSDMKKALQRYNFSLNQRFFFLFFFYQRQKISY